MTIETLTELLGWTAVINIIVLTVSTLAIMAMQGMMTNIHSRLFGLDQTYLAKAYFQYLGQFKIVVIVFNIAPYLALRIMA
jgi:hypothetical protein